MVRGLQQWDEACVSPSIAKKGTTMWEDSDGEEPEKKSRQKYKYWGTEREMYQGIFYIPDPKHLFDLHSLGCQHSN